MQSSLRIVVRVLVGVGIILGFFVGADLLLPTAMAKRYQYDAKGRLVKRITPNGRVIKYQYDKGGRLAGLSYHRLGAITKLAYPARDSVDFEYDAAGNRIAMKDTHGKTRYRYDETSRLTEVVSPDGKRLSYEYDAWNQIRRITLPDGRSTKYQYDVLGNVTAVDNGQGAIRYEYRGDVNRVQRLLPNGVLTTYESSPAGRLISIRHSRSDGSLICAFRYEYDVQERVSAIEELTSQGASTTRYEYDLAGRLSKVRQPDGSTVSYEYDLMGNRTAQTDSAGTIRYEYDSLGRLTKAGETIFSYDASGNLLSKKDKSRSFTYEYDDEDRLIEARTGRKTIRYAYDGEGNRVRREVNGKATNYLTDQTSDVPQVLAEYGKAGKLSSYLLGVTRVGRSSANGEQFFFLEDHLGSTRCVVNGQGEVIARYSYSPFGKPQLIEGSAQTDFLYTGEQWDPDAQLLYLRSRYYDPEVGRFLSADRLPGSADSPASFNEYTYVSNDPINQVDPLGMQGWRPPPFYNPNIDWWKYLPPPSIDIRPRRPPPPATHSWWYYFSGELAKMAARGELFRPNSEHDYYFRAILKWHPVSAGILLANDVLYDATHKKEGTALLNLFRRGLQEELKSRNPGLGSVMGRLAAGVGTFNELSHTQLFQEGYSAVSTWWDRRQKDEAELRSSFDLRILDSLDQKRNIFFPPPGGGGGGVPAVGGVYLDQTARIIGDLGAITGAMYDPESGQLILIGDKNTALPPMKPEYLAAAIRAVYSQSPEAPGMTIDPHPANPRGPTMLVRFFGNTENTRLGWVMFEADRVMKGYSVGRDNITKQRVESSVPGYRSVTAMGLADGGVNQGIWSRFWLIPEPVIARVVQDGRAVAFDPIRMKVETQTMVWNGGKLVPAGDNVKDAHAEAFKAHFTAHYEEFAKENRIYSELKQVTQTVALAKWMRQQGIPPNWTFVRSVAAAHPTPEITPSAYDELTRTSRDGLITHFDRVSTFGGVDMDPKLDFRAQPEVEQFRNIVTKAWATARKTESPSFEFEFQKKRYSAVALPSIDQREPAAYDTVEVDLDGVSDAMAKLPGLARYYNSTHNEATEFDYSWSLLLPRLQFEAAGEKGRLGYVSVEGDPATQVLVQSFLLTNDFGLGQERFSRHFVDQGLKRIGFSPESDSSLCRALYPEADGSYRLLFKDPRQAVFDQQGKLRALFTPVQNIEGESITQVLAPEHKALYDYDQAGRLIAIRSFVGEKEEQTRFEYDSKGRLLRCSSGVDAATYDYDQNGNLRSVRVGLQETSYRYDERRLLREITSNGQTVLKNDYDELGRLVKQRDSNGRESEHSFAASPDGRVVTVRDGAGEFKRHYDKQSRLAVVTDDVGNSYKYSNDDVGRVSAVEAAFPTGAKARLQVSADRSAITALDPRGVRAEAHFGARGEVRRVLINNQPEADYKYDSHNNLVEATYGTGDVERFEYDEGNRLVAYRRVPADDMRTEQAIKYSYDSHGNLLGINSAGIGQINLSAQPQAFTGTRGNAALTLRFDTAGRPSLFEAPDGSVVRCDYGPDGRLSAIETSKNGRNGRVDLMQDNSVVVIDLAGGKTEYTYASAGQLASVKGPHGEGTSYVYDERGRLREIHFPNGGGIEYRYSTSRSGSQTVTAIRHLRSTGSNTRRSTGGGMLWMRLTY